MNQTRACCPRPPQRPVQVLDGANQDGRVSHKEMAEYYFIVGTSHHALNADSVAESVFTTMDLDGSKDLDYAEFETYFSDLKGLNSASPNASGVRACVRLRGVWGCCASPSHLVVVLVPAADSHFHDQQPG